jgi:hypothetical protein
MPNDHKKIYETHGIETSPAKLRKGDVVFYEMSQFLSARKWLSKMADLWFGLYHRLFGTIGGFPKICHIGVCVEEGSDDPHIIDFCDYNGGALNRMRMSKWSQWAVCKKIYVCNTKWDPLQENAAVRAEKYYSEWKAGNSTLWAHYDMWSHNCSDFVNKCLVLSGYKFSEVQSINKRINSNAELLAEYFAVSVETMSDGYRKILKEKHFEAAPAK